MRPGEGVKIPGGGVEMPGGATGTVIESVDWGRIAGDIGPCEPDPISDSMVEDEGDRGGCGTSLDSLCLSIFTSAGVAGF